jgi:hypothetical protein
MNFGLRGLLLLLAVVLFVVGALMDPSDTRQDLQYWGLAVFAASFVAGHIPFGRMPGERNRN